MDMIEEIISSQYEWIAEHFSGDVSTNIGWGVSEDGVASKIYGEEGGILDSWAMDGTIYHDFEPWSKTD